MSKFCIHCGMENADRAVVCMRCKDSLSDAVYAEPPPIKRQIGFTTKFCVHCGKENAGQAVVCTRCSNSLADAVPAEPPPNQSSGDVASSYLPVILGSLVLILYCCSWVHIASHTEVFDGISGFTLSEGNKMLYIVPIYAVALIALPFLLQNGRITPEGVKIIAWCGAVLLTIACVDMWIHPFNYIHPSTPPPYSPLFGYDSPAEQHLIARMNEWESFRTINFNVCFYLEILMVFAGAWSVSVLKNPDSIKAGVTKKSLQGQ